MRRRLLCLASLTLFASLAAAGACRRESSGPPPGPWQRLDLWIERPAIEIDPLRGSETAPDRRLLSYLGAAEVRDLARVAPEQLARYPHQSAGQIRAIEQIAGSRLKWTVDLGAEPYFSFIPLVDPAHTCRCLFRVGVRDAAGKLAEVQRIAADRVPPPAPPTATADLAAWAGQRVDLLLEVYAPPEEGIGAAAPRVLWGSPAVYSRGAATTVPGRRTGPPNVLLLGIDTLRADQLGAYGRDPSPTPAIDRLAAESDVWLDAYSALNVTNPSFASILTGLWGKDHGIYDLQTPLPAADTTLAELFSEAGYDTMAILSARHLGDDHSGLGQGFADVTTAAESFAAELPVDMAMDWIATRERPFFAWVHLFDPHTPHTPPEPFALGFRPAHAGGLSPIAGWAPFRSPGPVLYDEPILAGRRELYTGEVAYLDHQVDRLLDFLRSRGLLEHTVVVLVADHGENLGEHGILYRHIGLWETTLHVPMMIRWPGAGHGGRRIHGLVQTIDLFPTLLGATGIEPPPSDGTDLAELTAGGRKGRRAVFSEHASRLGLRVRTVEYSYMVSAGNPQIPDGAYLFDLAADPGETRNLAGQGIAAEKTLAALLTRWAADRRPDAGAPQPQNLSEEEERQLRALGYQ